MKKKLKTSKKKKSPTKKPPPRKPHYDPLNVTEAELINGLDEDLRDAWKKLRAFSAALGIQRIYASHHSIMFSKKICYFFVRPRKAHLEVWIFLPRKIEGLKSMRSSTKKVKFCNLFKLIHADQVEEPLTNWIQEAFAFTPEMGQS